VRKPLIVMGALSAALLAGPIPAGAAAALPKVVDTAIPSVGPFPTVSGFGSTLRGDISLGWHGQPPADAAAGGKVPDTAIPSVGPFPAISGYGRTVLGDITLGWHGPPPAAAATKRLRVRSAAHRHPRRPAAEAKRRSSWG
jgi:hypothetical protein